MARNEIRSLAPCTHGGDVWEIAGEREMLAGEILDFSANANPLGPSPKVLEAIKNALWRVRFYPSSSLTKLREAISHYIGGTNVDNIIVGNGSTELIYLICDVFINRGDEALIPIPTFGEYENSVRKMGGRARLIKSGQGFFIDPIKLLREVGSSTKIIFLCNPNNPTGSLISKKDLVEVVEKASKEHVLVLVDEAFIEFVDNEKRFSLASEVEKYRNLIVLRSFTKVFGLTGLRVGYGIASEEIIDLLHRSKMPWSVNCLGEVAAIAALEDLEHLERTRSIIYEERRFLLEGLKKIKGFKVFPTHANFILVNVWGTGFTAAELRERMLKYGILIRDCSSFEGLDEYYIRVAIRMRWENEMLLAAFKKIVEAQA